MAKEKNDQLTEIVKAGFASLEARMEKGFGAVAKMSKSFARSSRATSPT